MILDLDVFAQKTRIVNLNHPGKIGDGFGSENKKGEYL